MKPCCLRRQRHGSIAVESYPDACHHCVAAYHVGRAIVQLRDESNPVKAFLAMEAAARRLKDALRGHE